VQRCHGRDREFESRRSCHFFQELQVPIPETIENANLGEFGKKLSMSDKPARSHALTSRLARSREINISVTGRKSGRAISIPVWFVLDDEKLYLLPVHGSNTEWYKNVIKYPSVRIDAGGEKSEIKVVPVTDATQVSSVVERFRGNYGGGGIKLYSKLDVAVLAQIQ
jgi:deazaflavin-dependent oxidoreductase (nitroreductase family)